MTETTPPAENAVSARPLVLLVEDAPDMRETAHEAIDILGYEVISVGSAELALDEIERLDKLDVLITDISLPGKSGLELAALCVEKHPGLKVIFASGYGEVSEHLGVNGWSLPKPYDLSALDKLLAEVCGRPAGGA